MKLDPKLLKGIAIAVVIGLLGLSAVAMDWGKDLACGVCAGLQPAPVPTSSVAE